MRIYFVRHGQSNYNVRHLCNDDPKKRVYLTKLGKGQIEDVARKLNNKNIEIIFASELPRTIQSAKIINKFHKVPIIIDFRINDRKTGFEGRPYDEYINTLKNNIFYEKVKYGESFQDEKKRVFSFLRDFRKLKYKHILVVAHEETLKIAYGYFNKLSDEEIWEIRVPNGYIMEF